MSEIDRRAFLAALGALPIFRLKAEATEPSGSFRLRPDGKIRVGYAAITWGGNDEQAIEEIAGAGYKGIQLRASAFDTWGAKPDVLRALLQKRGLTFAVLSSGNLKYDAPSRQEQLDLHTSHAKFVRDAGGQFLQVIDEQPKGRPIGPGDYAALADMLNALGERTKAIGVPLLYHHHMNSTGETPEAIEAIMSDSAASSVGLLFDIAHYQQGGGDPVKAIRQYPKAIKAVHLKDVRPIDAAPGYQWVELGRGRVDVKGCVAALRDVGYDGWTIVELDRVVDPAGSPKASAIANRQYVEKQLGLTL
jgi:inosose dehydratase